MRKARKNYVSHFLHIIVQGIEKQYIFEKEIYKEKYLNFINDNIKDFKIKLIAYSIMDNHMHMCIYYKKIEDVSKFMHKINSKFANHYNKSENRVGYLFRNRFYSQEIKDQQHLFNVISYIHHNPVKAQLVNKLDKYKYSSYNTYMYNKIDKEILKLVFGTLEYIEIFKYIHQKYSNINILEIQEDNLVDYKILIKEYLKENKISVNILRKDNNMLFELIKKLKTETRTLNKEISEYLKIDKNRVTRINRKIIEEYEKNLNK